MKHVLPKSLALVVTVLASAAIGTPAVAQDGSFFTNDMFIEEDVMIEGAFDSGIVVETFDETVEEEDETYSPDEQDYEDE